jgi:hypothetical protein
VRRGPIPEVGIVFRVPDHPAAVLHIRERRTVPKDIALGVRGNPRWIPRERDRVRRRQLGVEQEQLEPAVAPCVRSFFAAVGGLAGVDAEIDRHERIAAVGEDARVHLDDDVGRDLRVRSTARPTLDQLAVARFEPAPSARDQR